MNNKAEPGLRLPASVSALGRASHPAGRGPSLSSLFLPLAAVASAAEIEKDRHTNVYRSFSVGAAGFEPTASSSRTRRATNCAMPRKYRSRLGCGLVGDERIELPQVESESTALPLCKSPLFCLSAALCAADREYYTRKGLACQPFFYFFRKTFLPPALPAKTVRGVV